MQRADVNVSEVIYSDVRGTCAEEQAITVNCSEKGCFNITMDQVNITASVLGKATTAFCKNAHGTSTAAASHVSCLSGSHQISLQLSEPNSTN